MSDLYSVFDAVVRWIGEALFAFSEHWFTLILLFLFVLNFIVSLLILFRGGH